MPILHVLVMIPSPALFEVGILLVQIYLPTPKSPALTNSQRSDSFQ
jgi:Sec-independent protein secretion pathway component TatC